MNNSKNRKIGATLSMVNMVASLVIGLFYTPFLLRYLGKNEFGVYSLANSLISYLAILDLGFGNTLIRYVSRARASGDDESNIYGMFLVFYTIISIIALIIGMVLYINIDSFFATSFTAGEISTLRILFLILLANTVIAFPASVFSSIIRSHEKFVFINTINLASNIFRHLANMAFLYMGYKSISIVVIALLMTVVLFIFNLYYCFNKLKIKIGFKRFEMVFYKEVFLFSFFVLINIIVDQLYANTDNIILGKICGSAAVAVYGIGVTFQTYFLQFSTAISGVFLPHISRLSALNSNVKEMSNIFIRVGRIQFFILCFILFGFISFGRDFISLWAGLGFESSYYIALIIMIPAIIPLSQNIGISVLQAMNKHSIRSIMYLFIAIINVLISIPLAAMYGGVGAATGTAIGNILGQILFMNWFYYKKIGLNIPGYWKNISMIFIKMLPVLGLFVLVNTLVPNVSWTALIIKIGLCSIVAIIYCYIVVLNRSEKDLITEDFKKKLV